MTPTSQITTLREAMGLTQQEFADRIGLATRGQVSRMEAGDYPVTLAIALRLEELGREHGVAIDAAQLNEGVALARAACLGGCEAVSALHDDGLSPSAADLSAGKMAEISSAATAAPQVERAA